jgi:hypothetical protein
MKRATMHCLGIACSKTFEIGSASAEKLECFKRTAKNIYMYYENLLNIF